MPPASSGWAEAVAASRASHAREQYASCIGEQIDPDNWLDAAAFSAASSLFSFMEKNPAIAIRAILDLFKANRRNPFAVLGGIIIWALIQGLIFPEKKGERGK